ncbi:MAG: response regulator [Thermoanaerobaculia bacterium]|nr:response regulator [Thermoanaerobaculia bacterium]
MTVDVFDASAGRVLAVDDQIENRELIAEILSIDSYVVDLATNGVEALERIEANPPDCVILDVMMPRLDGFEVCRRLKGSRRTHFLPVVMLTSLTSVDDKVRAFDAGADDFLNKPVNSVELRARVRSLVRIKRLRDELDTSESIIASMIHALESKDSRNLGHSRRVARVAVALASDMGLSPTEVESIGRGALLHDLGKIGVPEAVLSPLGALDSSQVDAYRRHPILAEEILAPLRSFASIRPLVRHHHERLDGRGYPDRIGGEEFDRAREIVALANFYDHVRARYGAPGVAEPLREVATGGAFRLDTVETLLALGDLESSRGNVNDVLDRLPVRDTARTGRVVVVDDVASNREVLSDVLTDAGHEVIALESGVDLIAVLERKPDLILLDVQMPGQDGFSLCKMLKSRPGTEFLPVILVTAHHGRGDRGLGAEVGADDFLLYPINRLELQARVASLLRLRLYFQDLEEYQSAIMSLGSALEAKDAYTRGHSERVGYLAVRLARKLGLPAAESEEMLVAGMLHDIGKIGISEALLNKADSLTVEEFEEVMRHPVIGEEICRPLHSARRVLPLIRHHHERFDGSGYPDRLVGDAIPFGARILGVADAYDALTSRRSYRTSVAPEAAVQVLVGEMIEGRWDPQVIDALKAVLAGSST